MSKVLKKQRTTKNSQESRAKSQESRQIDELTN